MVHARFVVEDSGNRFLGLLRERRTELRSLPTLLHVVLDELFSVCLENVVYLV